jgi:hypothetical protein
VRDATTGPGHLAASSLGLVYPLVCSIVAIYPAGSTLRRKRTRSQNMSTGRRKRTRVITFGLPIDALNSDLDLRAMNEHAYTPSGSCFESKKI